MMPIYPIVALVTLAGLLYGEKTENRRLVYVFKPLTSLLFILTALGGGVGGVYGLWLLAGLVLCLAGDVALIPKSRRWFMVGLVAFLLGHVCYIVAFNSLVLFTSLNLVVAGLIVVVSSFVAFRFWPHLGRMQIPVAAYIVAISLMVWSAWAVFFNAPVPSLAKWLIALGATCFYFSDVSVALNTFVKSSFTNRAWGLPLYYLGQFLLAFSVAAM
jgi:uncharacterized membrane protein YhhN